MGDKEKIVIYHLFRKDDTSLFLHPFGESEKSVDIFENAEISGKYGREPRVEAFTMLRNELYRLTEELVNNWVSEIRFIPKFLISAGVFLVTYLFFSLVIRDPVPMIDEIALGLGAAVVTFILLGRRDKRSDLSLKKRVTLRSKVDKVVFSEDDFIKQIEEALQKCESESQDRMIDTIFDPLKVPLTEEEKEDAKRITAYLKKQFKTRELKRKEKIVSKLSKEKKEGKNLRILPLLTDKKTDLPLFTIYTRIKKSYETADSVK